MRKAIVISLLVSVLVGCENSPALTCSSMIENAKENGRFAEKLRWADYHIHVKQEKIISTQFSLLRKEITIDSALEVMTEIANDNTPFYTVTSYR